MSIYHRYALFYNLQRYLDDVDNLCDLALEGNVVEDVPGHEPSAAPQQAATCKYIYEDPIPDIEPSNSDDIERKEDAQLSTRDDMNGHKQDDPNDDKENRYDRNALDEQHHNDAQFGDVRTEANGHEAVSGVQLDDDDEGRMYELACGLEAVTTQSDRDTTANDPSLAPDASGQSQSADDNASTSTTSTENGQPQFSIKRSQLNRMMACERVLLRMNSALIKNIRRIETRESELSSQTIQHFWREAARLQGSERIKSIRVQERELAASSWWDGDSDCNNEEENTSSPGKEKTPSRLATTAGTLRLHRSPLYKTLDPDDLQWEDQVQGWQMGLGRTVDDEGRRFYKM